MSVHKLPDGRWFVQWPNPSPPPRLKRRYFGRAADSEARAREYNESLQLRGGRPREPESYGPYFEDIAQAYLEVKETTLPDESYRILYNRFHTTILPILGTVSVPNLAPEHLDAYTRRRLKAGVRKTTINVEITYVMAALNQAVKRKAIRYNPLTGYEKPARDDRVTRPPSVSEVAALFSKAAPHLVRAIALSYYTGLRPGAVELLRIRWSDVDWDAKTIMITSARKKGPRVRHVPIFPEFLPRLEAWWAEDDKTDNFIIRYRGHPIKSIHHAFNQAKKEAQITRPLRMYGLRHAFATNLLAAGADLKSVSELIGHSRPDTTMTIYQHTDLTLHRKTISLLPVVEIPSAVILGNNSKKTARKGLKSKDKK